MDRPPNEAEAKREPAARTGEGSQFWGGVPLRVRTRRIELRCMRRRRSGATPAVTIGEHAGSYRRRVDGRTDGEGEIRCADGCRIASGGWISR